MIIRIGADMIFEVESASTLTDAAGFLTLAMAAIFLMSQVPTMVNGLAGTVVATASGVREMGQMKAGAVSMGRGVATGVSAAGPAAKALATAGRAASQAEPGNRAPAPGQTLRLAGSVLDGNRTLRGRDPGNRPAAQGDPALCVMVDRKTGESELIVSTMPGSLSKRDAVREAELVRYISERETYDNTDNATRIPQVLITSEGQAADSLRALWNSTAPQYPPAIYGADTLIRTRVLSVTVLNDTTAQVRFTRALEEPGLPPVERAFVATVGFAFRPKTERTLEAVWKNPLGFVATSYRVDAETLDAPGK